MNSEKVAVAVSALFALAAETKRKYDDVVLGLTEAEADQAIKTVMSSVLPMVQEFIGRAMSASGRDD
jgi:hypothetical protein